MKVGINKGIYDKYKDDNSQDHSSTEIFVNKNEEEEALIGILMEITFSLKVVNDMLGTINSCGEKMIELENKIK